MLDFILDFIVKYGIGVIFGIFVILVFYAFFIDEGGAPQGHGPKPPIEDHPRGCQCYDCCPYR